MVELQPSKLEVAGSSPVARSKVFIIKRSALAAGLFLLSFSLDFRMGLYNIRYDTVCGKVVRRRDQMDQNGHKQRIAAVFDKASEGYDNAALGYFRESAAYLVEYMGLKGGERLLDVATGTGHVAVAAAQRLGSGSVTGIDISERMLEKARNKADALKINNVGFRHCDIEDMGFADNSFDAACCSFGLFFLPDIKNGLNSISKVIKPGGRFYLTGFSSSFMEPQKGMFMGRLKTYGVDPPDFRSSMGLMDTEDKIRELLQATGYKDIDTRTRQLGYYLKDAQGWMDILWNSAFRSPLTQLSEKDLNRFTAEHQQEVESLRVKDGIWLDIQVLYASGTVGKVMSALPGNV